MREDPLEDRDPEDLEPPDRPEGSFEDATATSGQLEGESIDERVGRERPDRDEEPDRSHRLSEEDRPDAEPQLLGDLADDQDDLSAEEAAVQVDEEAPGATTDASDGYVDEERG